VSDREHTTLPLKLLGGPSNAQTSRLVWELERERRIS